MLRAASRVPGKTQAAAVAAAAVTAAVETAHADNQAWISRPIESDELHMSWEAVAVTPNAVRSPYIGKVNGVVNREPEVGPSAVSLAPPSRAEAVAAVGDLTALCSDLTALNRDGKGLPHLMKSPSRSSNSSDGSSHAGSHVCDYDVNKSLEESESAMLAARWALRDHGGHGATLSGSALVHSSDSQSQKPFLLAIQEAQRNPAILETIVSLAINPEVANVILNQPECQRLLQSYKTVVSCSSEDSSTEGGSKPSKGFFSFIIDAVASLAEKLQDVLRNLLEPKKPAAKNETGSSKQGEAGDSFGLIGAVVAAVVLVLVVVIMKRPFADLHRDAAKVMKMCKNIATVP